MISRNLKQFLALALVLASFVAGAVTVTPVEYLESTGTQFIKCGVHFKYGHRFILRWSQASYSYVSGSEDKGWGTGSTTANNITGGGRRSSNVLQPYLFSANRVFSPTMANAAIVLYDPYEDVCTVQDTTTYTMTRLADGTSRAIAAVSTPNTTTYDSASDICLFYGGAAYPQYGKKRIYRATYETVDGTPVFDLFPVKVDGKPAYYDRVSKQFLYNGATSGAAFTMGPETSSFRLSGSGDIEFAAAASVDAAGGGTATLTFGSTTFTNGKAFWLAVGGTGDFTYAATPDANSAFTGWTGDTVGLTSEQLASPTLVLTGSRPRVLTATFARPTGVLPTTIYAQSGLINQWDGIDNGGVGIHSGNSKVWKDLKGSLDLTLCPWGSWSTNGSSLVVASGPAAYGTNATPAYSAIEVVYKMKAACRLLFASGCTTGGNHRWVLMDDGGSGYYKFYSEGGASTPYVLNKVESMVIKSYAAVYSGNAVSGIYTNGLKIVSPANLSNTWGIGDGKVMIGARALNDLTYVFNGEVYAIRLYNRVLTDDELRVNALADRLRFMGANDVRYVGTCPSGHFESRVDYVSSDTARGTITCKVGSTTQPAAESVWAAADQTVTLTPSAKSGYKFYCWEGDTNGTTVAANGEMTFKSYPHALVARFVKSSSTPTVRTMTLASNATKEWNVAANWSPNGVPVEDDDVKITGYGTVTLGTSTPVLSSLTIQGNSSSQYAYLSCANWTTKVNANEVTVKAWGSITTPATVLNANMSNRVYIVCRDLDVQANGQINVNFKGYANNNGPAWDGIEGTIEGASGGAYGGLSSNGTGANRAHCYGSLVEPTDLGSGGYRYSGANNNGLGGGAIRVESSGNVNVDGAVTAKGQATAIWGYGGGSGGSIYISTKTISGKGSVDAGTVDNYSQNGHSNGGGGRLAVHYDPTAQTAKDAECMVWFGARAGSGSFTLHWPYNGIPAADLTKGYVQPPWWVGGLGQNGTMWFTDYRFLTNPVRLANGVLLSGRFYSGEALPKTLHLPGPVLFNNSFLEFDEPFESLEIDGDATMKGTYYITSGIKHTNTTFKVHGDVFMAGSMIKQIGGTTEIDGNLMMTNSTSDAINYSARLDIKAMDMSSVSNAEFGATFRVKGTWTLNKYGVVYPRAEPVSGYVPYFDCLNFDMKPTSYFDALLCGYGVTQGPGYGKGATGSSHGGRGGTNAQASKSKIPEPYGDEKRPITPGSGSNQSFVGGGAICVRARNRMDFNGYAMAHGNGWSSNWCYGSSGGSVFLSAARFASTNGYITVRGGKTTQYSVGCGGGGRVSICARALLSTNVVIYLNGGDPIASEIIPAEPGTLYWFNNTGSMFLVR